MSAQLKVQNVVIPAAKVEKVKLLLAERDTLLDAAWTDQMTEDESRAAMARADKLSRIIANEMSFIL